MPRFLFLCLAALGLFAASGSAPAQDRPAGDRPAQNRPGQDAGAAFTVTGITLDVRAPTSDDARDAAFREAPRRAWPRLWARLTGNEAASAPEMSDAALSAILDGIEIEEEKVGSGRYIATLAVAFSRQRAGRYLPAGARVVQSRPMLLVPVLMEAGAMSTYDPSSPWFEAWQAFPSGASTIDYVRPRGTAADRVIVNGWQGLRGDRGLWRQILARYGADNVLTAEARLLRTYPGGPVTGYFIARYGPDAQILSDFTLRAASSAEMPEMLATAVQRIDDAYVRALEQGVLRAEESLSLDLASISAPPVEIDDGFASLGLIGAQVPTPTPADWVQMEELLSGIPLIDRLTLTSLQVGGLSAVELVTSASEAQLRAALARRGVALAGAEGAYVLRRLQTGEAPAAPEGTAPAQAPAPTPPADAAEPAGVEPEEQPESLLPALEDEGAGQR